MLIANGLKDNKQIVAVFLTSIGSKTYNLLRNLKAPEKPSDVKLSEFLSHARPVPQALKGATEIELDRLEGMGVRRKSSLLGMGKPYRTRSKTRFVEITKS